MGDEYGQRACDLGQSRWVPNTAAIALPPASSSATAVPKPAPDLQPAVGVEAQAPALGAEQLTTKTKAKVKRRRAKQLRRPLVRHKQPRLNCDLCRIELPNDGMTELWHSNRLPLERRVPVMEEAIRRHGLGVTVDQVRAHFRDHRAPQPAPTSRQVEEDFEQFCAWVAREPRRLEVLRFVAQSKLASSAQIAELFYSHTTEPLTHARHLLRQAAYRDGIYRIYFDSWSPQRQEVAEVFVIGRAGAELLSHLSPISWGWGSAPEAVKPQRMVHDLGVGDYALGLRRSCGEAEIAGRRVRTSVPLENYWATEIALGITVPAHQNEREEQQAAKRKLVVADGFLTVGFELVAGAEKGIAESFGLPVIVERHRGTRDNSEAVEQIFLNLVASASGAWAERFPELKAAKGVRPPLLFVIESRSPGGDSSKALLTLKRESEKLAQNRIVTSGGARRSFAQLFKDGPACLLARDRDIRELGLRAPVAPLFSGLENVADGPLLIEQLIAANPTLRASGTIAADQVLEIDPLGARWEGPRGRKKLADAEELEPLGGREQHRIGESREQRKAAEAAQRQRQAEREAFEAEIRAAREEAGRG